MDNSTKLFGRKTKQHWIDIRDKIQQNPDEESNWEEATKLLELRLNTRYFSPISKILKPPNISTTEDAIVMALSGEGFAGMTLICSLIEFLQSCYEGKKYNRDNPDDHFEYEGSGRKFKKFLECNDPFRDIFTQNVPIQTKEIKTFADDFYSSVRCGLLHEAATNNNWIVRQKPDNPNSNDFVDVRDTTRKIIYRDNFFNEIKIYFGKYKQKIIDNEIGTVTVKNQTNNTFLTKRITALAKSKERIFCPRNARNIRIKRKRFFGCVFYFRVFACLAGNFRVCANDQIVLMRLCNSPAKRIYLRHAFCRKIDFLCDILLCDIPDRSPEWWDLTRIYSEN